MLTTLANPDQVESVQLYKNGGVGALNDMGTQEGCGTLTRTLPLTLPLPLPLPLTLPLPLPLTLPLTLALTPNPTPKPMGTQEAAVHAERWSWVVVTRKPGELSTYANGLTHTPHPHPHLTLTLTRRAADLRQRPALCSHQAGGA